jgi:hypothetical protein
LATRDSALSSIKFKASRNALLRASGLGVVIGLIGWRADSASRIRVKDLIRSALADPSSAVRARAVWKIGNSDNLAKRELIPDLKTKGLRWHGWHAFRRGLATNLRELGIPDGVILRILRNADSGTAQAHSAVRKAMSKLDRSLKRDSQKYGW